MPTRRRRRKPASESRVSDLIRFEVMIEHPIHEACELIHAVFHGPERSKSVVWNRMGATRRIGEARRRLLRRAAPRRAATGPRQTHAFRIAAKRFLQEEQLVCRYIRANRGESRTTAALCCNVQNRSRTDIATKRQHYTTTIFRFIQRPTTRRAERLSGWSLAVCQK